MFSASPARSNRAAKYSLWLVMGLATLSVVLYSEVPLLQQAQEQARLHALRWILIPHAIAGLTALLSGPIQFSSRLRRHRPIAHRIVGWIYVCSVLLAAPLAIISTPFSHYAKAYYFQTAIAVQGGAWLVTTVIAVLAAVGRRIGQHRRWMVRSYAVTFTFVATRMLQPIPAWNRLGRFWFAAAIICFTFLALLTPTFISVAESLLGRWSRSPVE